MGDAIDAVIELKRAGEQNPGVMLQKLQVSADLYEALMLECAPLTPSEYFDVKVEVLPDEEPEGPALH